MKMTTAMKKRIARLSRDEFRYVNFDCAPAALRNLISAGEIIEGPEEVNEHGIKQKTYRLK